MRFIRIYLKQRQMSLDEADPADIHQAYKESELAYSTTKDDSSRIANFSRLIQMMQKEDDPTKGGPRWETGRFLPFLQRFTPDDLIVRLTRSSQHGTYNTIALTPLHIDAYLSQWHQHIQTADSEWKLRKPRNAFQNAQAWSKTTL